MRKEELDQLLTSLEDKIRELKQDLHRSKSSEIDDTFVQRVIAFFEEIIKTIGIDSALEEKRRIYGNIVEFLKNRGSNRGAERAYLSAAYHLCNETDSRLTYGNDYSQFVEEITSWAREIIIAIKVYYEKLPNGTVIFRTEIFSKGISNSSPTRSQWEMKGHWDGLPSKVREEFIRTGNKSVDYMWYPPSQNGNLK